MSRAHQRSTKQQPQQKELRAIDALINQGRYLDAEEKARMLMERYPRNGNVLGILGLSLVSQTKYDAALSILQEANTLLSDTPAILSALGVCLLVTGQPEAARPLLERALALQPNRLAARTSLGDVYISLGEVEKGRQCFLENLRRDPLNIGAHYSLSNFITYQPTDEIFTYFPSLMEDEAVSLKNKVTVAFSLGKAYWDIGDIERAFGYYRKGNELSKSLKKAPNLHEASGIKTVQHFSSKHFVNLQAGGLSEVPQLVISGLSRSGKSLVESLLDGANGLVKSGESHQLSLYIKSILAPYGGNISEYLEALTPEKCRADAQGYLNYIDYDGSAKITTRPADIWALGLIGLWFPKAPIVFCQRDLMDVGLTAYFNHYTQANDHTNDLYSLGEHIAFYEQAMQHWAKVLPNPIYWVGYEELTHQPDIVSKRLLSALSASENTSYIEQAERHAGLVEHLSPVRSLDVPMPIRKDFNGVSKPFMHHLEPLRDGYQAAMQAHGLPCEPVEHFDWNLQGRLVVVDNAARLPREDNFRELMASNAFGVIAFDPVSRVAADEVAEVEEFQHVPHALLGDGQPATLYATLDAEFSAPLAPLPAEQLPKSVRSGASVLTRLPINTLRLNDIEGLASLDWLILDEQSDAMAVLENGEKALADTLLLQVGVAFQPTHHRQPNLAEISHWASRHGFSFYRLNNPKHRSLMPARDDIGRPQATQLATADALFIPSPDRLATLEFKQCQRLAFMLDTVFGIHDLPYQLLAERDAKLAERYLKIRGYTGANLVASKTGEPSFLALRKPNRIAERGLAAALANHNIHRAISLAQQLLKEHPGDAEGRYYLGQALSRLGQHEQAITKLSELCTAEEDLRYWLALGFAQCRAGQAKAARRTHEQLTERFPDHLAVARFALELTKGSHKRREQEQALAQCEALLGHTDSTLVAAGLGDALSARADLLALKAIFQQSMASSADEYQAALAAHEAALRMLDTHQGPLRARLLMNLASAQRAINEPANAVTSLWQACNTYPYSLKTVAAYKQLRAALVESPNAEHRELASLHTKVQEIWRGYQSEQLKYSFGDFGLPYQGFEPLMLPGTRSVKARLGHYQLEKWLPGNATALDIGCNHGFLLMGLADKLLAGEGFDISKACVEVGNTVAKYLNYPHIKLHHKAFDDFVGKKQYDLVIACAVHQWIGKPLEDFGEALFALCKPGGIVLLESQGARDRYATEAGFEDNATAIASAGFGVIHKGSICDDALNYREFWILKRKVEQPALKNISKDNRAKLPRMEGDEEALRPMRHICHLLSKNGAWFNPDLCIKSDNGNLSLHGTPGAPRASYMRVPMALMPQLECFDIVNRSGSLLATPNGTPLLAHQQDMMEAMMELYNATDKLKLWGESLPFAAWKAPKVLEYLLSARPLNDNLTHYHKLFRAGEQASLLVDSFLGSRKFSVNEHSLKALGINGPAMQRFALMPLVDCLNHRLNAEGFATPLVDGKPTMRTFHVPDIETGELFVRYNLYDAVDTMLSYGFMDNACTWLSSVPVTLNVSGYLLDVQGGAMQLRGQLPVAFEDIRSYMPALHRKGERRAVITKLMLCTENFYSLRRVLTYIVYQLGMAHTELVARQQVAELESQLIEKNLQWWNGLEGLTQELPVNHPAKQLCQHSLDIIKTYQQAI
ncbi:tetratricopeptide repeat protein [Vreelandella zhanjiangensis]|uniref:tetratricopeptide repeat protein n=1 Tax=Vreelandella zhanjiangensis TaxID=1121960 RepID=UPI00402A9229